MTVTSSPARALASRWCDEAMLTRRSACGGPNIAQALKLVEDKDERGALCKELDAWLDKSQRWAAGLPKGKRGVLQAVRGFMQERLKVLKSSLASLANVVAPEMATDVHGFGGYDLEQRRRALTADWLHEIVGEVLCTECLELAPRLAPVAAATTGAAGSARAGGQAAAAAASERSTMFERLAAASDVPLGSVVKASFVLSCEGGAEAPRARGIVADALALFAMRNAGKSGPQALAGLLGDRDALCADLCAESNPVGAAADLPRPARLLCAAIVLGLGASPDALVPATLSPDMLGLIVDATATLEGVRMMRQLGRRENQGHRPATATATAAAAAATGAAGTTAAGREDDKDLDMAGRIKLESRVTEVRQGLAATSKRLASAAHMLHCVALGEHQ